MTWVHSNDFDSMHPRDHVQATCDILTAVARNTVRLGCLELLVILNVLNRKPRTSHVILHAEHVHSCVLHRFLYRFHYRVVIRWLIH